MSHSKSVVVITSSLALFYGMSEVLSGVFEEVNSVIFESSLSRCKGFDDVNVIIYHWVDKSCPDDKHEQSLVIEHAIRLGGQFVFCVDNNYIPEWLTTSDARRFSVISTSDSIASLFDSFKRIIHGRQVLTPGLIFSVYATEKAKLTQAESQVLQFLHKGYSITQIARMINRSIKTVSAHKGNIMKKYHAINDIQLFHKSCRELGDCCRLG